MERRTMSNGLFLLVVCFFFGDEQFLSDVYFMYHYYYYDHDHESCSYVQPAIFTKNIKVHPKKR